MQASQALRLILAAVATLAVAAVVIAVLLATDTVLSIWERLDNVAPWAVWLYGGGLVVIAGLTGWFVLRLALFRGYGKTAEDQVSAEALSRQIEQRRAEGIEVGDAERELERLEARRAEQRLYLAVFGRVSAGKSALINALLPGARRSSDPRGGTTQKIEVFDWDPEEGLPVRLVDMPGFDQREGETQGEHAREEALRAHVVVYVADGDLDRRQHTELQHLASFGKPVLVALNKADQFGGAELAQVRRRIEETIPADADARVVAVTAGGTEEILVVAPDGSERRELRPRTPNTAELVQAVASLLGADRERLDERREASVLALANVKLEEAERRYRTKAAEALVERYARRAVIGALAAVTPGSDLVIQGALATKLLSDLCNLYDLPLKEIDLDRFLKLAGSRVKRTTAIVLAVSGNALKAFPGIGTVVGGLVHAVAYGMIFDSLGRAVAEALAAGVPLRERQLADRFEQILGDGLEGRSRHFAKVAISHLTRDDRSEP
ncbi:MAG: GTPase domain-containing protein [Pseudomonadota bacterium]